MKNELTLTENEFQNLPENVRAEALSTLKAFSEVNIIFENGRYNVSTGISIRKSYPADHNFIGIVYADDVFTDDEKILNYIESFHDYPPQYKGKRDYQMLHKIAYDWNTKFEFDENHNIIVKGDNK